MPLILTSDVLGPPESTALQCMIDSLRAMLFTAEESGPFNPVPLASDSNAKGHIALTTQCSGLAMSLFGRGWPSTLSRVSAAPHTAATCTHRPLSCLVLSYSFPPTQRVRTCAHESSNSMFCFIGMHQSRDNRKQTTSVTVSPRTSFRHVLSQ